MGPSITLPQPKLPEQPRDFLPIARNRPNSLLGFTQCTRPPTQRTGAEPGGPDNAFHTSLRALVWMASASEGQKRLMTKTVHSQGPLSTLSSLAPNAAHTAAGYVVQLLQSSHCHSPRQPGAAPLPGGSSSTLGTPTHAPLLYPQAQVARHPSWHSFAACPSCCCDPIYFPPEDKPHAPHPTPQDSAQPGMVVICSWNLKLLNKQQMLYKCHFGFHGAFVHQDHQW